MTLVREGSLRSGSEDETHSGSRNLRIFGVWISTGNTGLVVNEGKMT